MCEVMSVVEVPCFILEESWGHSFVTMTIGCGTTNGPKWSTIDASGSIMAIRSIGILLHIKNRRHQTQSQRDVRDDEGRGGT